MTDIDLMDLDEEAIEDFFKDKNNEYFKDKSMKERL